MGVPLSAPVSATLVAAVGAAVVTAAGGCDSSDPHRMPGAAAEQQA
jgi:hypothetical protein